MKAWMVGAVALGLLVFFYIQDRGASKSLADLVKVRK
jgi:hypothetical protein